MTAPSAAKPDTTSPFDTGFGSFNELVDKISSTGMKDWINSQTAGGASDANAKRNQFIRDCAQLRKRLKSRQGFVNPRSTWIQYWDFATTIALLYTATITPYEVCVGLKSEWGPLWGINTFMNLIFMADIGVQFFLPVLNPETNEFIRDHKILANKYLKSWFVIDVGTVLPFDTLMLIVPDLFGSECGSGFTPVKAMKLLRIARLFKLVKILRASRILSRWESSISMSTSSRTLLTACTPPHVCSGPLAPSRAASSCRWSPPLCRTCWILRAPASPRLASPRLASPRLASPRLDSTRLGGFSPPPPRL